MSVKVKGKVVPVLHLPPRHYF